MKHSQGDIRAGKGNLPAQTLKMLKQEAGAGCGGGARFLLLPRPNTDEILEAGTHRAEKSGWNLAADLEMTKFTQNVHFMLSFLKFV